MSGRVDPDSHSREVSQQGPLSNVSSRIGIIANSIKDCIFTEMTKHPFRSTLIGGGSLLLGLALRFWYGMAALLLIGGYFVRKEYQSPEQLKQRLRQQLESEGKHRSFNHVFSLAAKNAKFLGDFQLRHFIGSQVENHWSALDLLHYVNTYENKKFLKEKLFAVLKNPNLNEEEKVEICSNVIKNYSYLFKQFNERISSDLNENKQLNDLFKLNPEYNVVKVTILGDETHNQGKVPLLVELTDGKDTTRIVYKPRSTIPELLVCGPNGLFAQVNCGLPSYRVVDVNEEYGYCEFLENKQEENTFKSDEDLQKYIKLMLLLDSFSKLLGINDLHRENIITSNLLPFSIDIETIMQPTQNNRYDTGIFDGNQSGYMFDVGSGSKTKNRVWSLQHDIDFALQSEKNRQLEDPLIKDEIDEFIASVSEKIAICQQSLYIHSHRMVLIPTDDLKYPLKMGFEEAFNYFKEELEDGLKEWNFESADLNFNEIKEAFQNDFMNHDVPVFYFRPASGEVSYHDIILGVQK